MPRKMLAAAGQSDRGLRICAFEKFLQELSYDELADVIAELGFVGIEATVRQGGHVLPERVEDDLPKLVEALGRRDLEVTIMTSDVLRIDDPLSERVLTTAHGLGIRRYRMGFYRYDLKQDIPTQIREIGAAMREVAAANGELGMTALYQNHSGANYFGATLWDLYGQLKDLPTNQIASAFDIRHATIEAGLAWPLVYRVMKPYIGALFVKDFDWSGPKAEHTPLGQGRVDPKFFQTVVAEGCEVPISLHVEYLPKAGTQANIDALRRDLKVLRQWLAA
jgi:sugar phosphate isomerase/epimerase